MKTFPSKSEQGQALVLIVFGIIALMGFTALAIDGSMVYADRRFAQDATDAAALAGAAAAGEKFDDSSITYQNWPCTSAPTETIPSGLVAAKNAAVNAAIKRAANNSMTIDGNLADDNGVRVTCGQETRNGITDRFMDVEVKVTSTTNTGFAQVITSSQLKNTTESIARIRPRSPANLGRYGIIAMGNCVNGAHTTSNSLVVDNLLFINGGGNDGGIATFNGGIFLNAPEPSGNGHCSIDPPNSAKSPGMVVHNDENTNFTIDSVGYHTYSGESKVNPNPIQISVNGGHQISDPLAGLPEPTCSQNGGLVNGRYKPGRYGGAGQPSLGAGTLDPGIYCITGSISEAGHGTLVGENVVLYFINGSLSYRGNSSMTITAPTAGHCLGVEGDPSASCTYKNIVVYMARNNTSTLDARGNGTFKFTGTVYGLWGTVAIKGGGNSAPDWCVYGQVIAASVAGNGGTVMNVYYNAENTYQKPPSLNLQR